MDFYNRVKSSCEQKKGIKLSEMTKILDLSSGMPSKWKNGTIPNGETLIVLADFLEESIDYLLGRETKKESAVIPNKNKNPEIQQIVHKLTTFEIPDDVIEFINNALDTYKK